MKVLEVLLHVFQILVSLYLFYLLVRAWHLVTDLRQAIVKWIDTELAEPTDDPTDKKK